MLDLHTSTAHTLTCAFTIQFAVVIDALEDELFDLEDELDLAAEEAYLTEEALEEADAAAATAAAGGAPSTMADLEPRGAPRK